MAAPRTAGPTNEQALADRIASIAAERGPVGITRDELLRRLGVAYDVLMAALDELQARSVVRVDWPTPDSFRVFSLR